MGYYMSAIFFILGFLFMALDFPIIVFFSGVFTGIFATMADFERIKNPN